MSADDESEKGFTLENLKRLERAIAKGVKSVKYTDKEITFHSIDEMLKARDVMRSCLGLNKNKGRNCGLFGGKRVNLHSSKGLTDCGNGDSNEHGERHDKDWYN